MKTQKTNIESILNQFKTKITSIQYFDSPTAVKNNWVFCTINNCIAFIEVLNLSGGVSDIVFELRNAGYKVKFIGLDIYIVQD